MDFKHLDEMKFHITLLCASVVCASVSLQRIGWLDRVVAFHKNGFLGDVNKLPPVQIKVTVQRAPAGYVDSKYWDTDSVLHLVALIRQSETARPVRRALRKALGPSRRFMTREKSYKAFPSLSMHHPNEFYYDIDSDEFYEDGNSTEVYDGFPDADALVVIGNPVEARLPSARISIALLKDILEARADAARIMPTTIKPIFTWKPKNTITGDGTNADNSTATTEDGAATGVGAGENTTDGDSSGGSETGATDGGDTGRQSSQHAGGEATTDAAVE